MKKLAKFLIILIIFLLTYFTLFKILEVDKIIMKKIYPLKYSEYVEKYSKEYNIDPYMTYAIIKAESNFDSEAKSSSEAIGLMQIMEETAEDVIATLDFEEYNLYSPNDNIQIGIKYFSYLLDKYKEPSLALAAYNAGLGNVDNWIKKGIIKSDGTDYENIPFKETNMYVRKILRDYEIYISKIS